MKRCLILPVLLSALACQQAPPDETGLAALRAELLAMAEEDQEIREYVASNFRPGESLDPEVGRRWARIDAANTARMQEIVAEHGWPGRSLVGEDGAGAAFLLVQHADQKPEFQKQCLPLLAAAVQAGEASPRDLAYLTDRVRVAEGRPQVYGTQIGYAGGVPSPLPMEDEANVDARRASVGLGPLSEYLLLFQSG